MSWFVICLPILIGAVVYLAPGALILRALGYRGVDTLLLAPVISLGASASSAVVLGAVGIRFAWWSLALLVVAGSGVIRLIRALRARHARASAAPLGDDAPAGDDGHGASSRAQRAGATGGKRATWAAIGIGLVINAVVVWWTYVAALAAPDSFIQTYDTPFHFSVITYLMETGNGSSIGAALVDRTVGSPFYPAGWHGTVALIASITHATVPVSVNASVILLLTLVWPLSAMALTRALMPGRPWAVLTAGAAAGVFTAFPMRFAIWGILYSNLASWVILPGAMVLFIRLFERRGRAAAAVAFLIAFSGVALCQPNGVFTALVLLIPFLISRVRRLRIPRLSRTAGVIAAELVLIGVIAVGWRVLFYSEFMQRTVTFDWPAHTDVPGATREILTGATNYMLPAPLVSTLTLLATATWTIMWWRRRDRSLWPAIALIISWGIYIVGSGVPSTHVAGYRPLNHFRDMLTGFWYHDQFRLAAIPVIVALPLIAGLVADLVGGIRMRTGDGGVLNRIRPGAIVAAVLVGALVVVPPLTGEFRVRRGNIAAESTLNDWWPLTRSELDFMHEVADRIGKGTPVLNNPYDGSAYGYSLAGLGTVYRSYEANWIGTSTKDQNMLHRVTANVTSYPAVVCPLLSRHDLRYILIMAKNNTTYDGHDGVRYDTKGWKGLEINDRTPGFTEVLGDDHGNRLYEVTACG